jgi:o-succinylbenzoate---CoA ligase
MQSPWIIANGITYNLSEIQQGQFKSNPENSALRFCNSWLNGENEFTLQTSGSTGKPKSIHVTRHQLKASAELTNSFLNLQRGYTSLICLDTRYIAGIMMLVRSMEAGLNMYIVEPTANPFEKIPSHVTIDFMALVPYQLETILGSPHKIELDKITIALVGGAPLSKEIREDLKSLSCTFYATYGMTETLSHIALQKLNGENTKDFFQTLNNISIEVDQRGCLLINAPHLGSDSIVTNDLVELISKNQFRWLGRFDNVINSGGVKVIPEKIESAITPLMTELNLINRFFISGLPDRTLGEAVILFIEGEMLETRLEQTLMQRLKETVGKYEVPKSIRYVSKFIQTDTGKVNKPKTLELINVK